jgi:ATP-dependent Clp protease adapter protein ClpS
MNKKLKVRVIFAANQNKPFGDDQRSVVMDREAQKVEPPPMFRVILINDDFTPMEFVVDGDRRVFSQGFRNCYKDYVAGSYGR